MKKKSRVRNEGKKIRDSLSDDSRLSHSKTINSYLIDYFQNLSSPASVSSYFAFGSEVDLSATNQWLIQNHRLLLPRTIFDPENHMEFVPIGSLEKDAFNLSKFGILEPIGPPAAVEEMVNYVLVPAVLFDKYGFRLGYGGGYYDRYFKERLEFQSKKPTYIGVAFSVQIVENLTTEPHDMFVDLIVTENGFLTPEQRNL